MTKVHPEDYMRLTHSKVKYLKGYYSMLQIEGVPAEKQTMEVNILELLRILNGAEGLLGPKVAQDSPLDVYCMRHPEEIEEYREYSKEAGMTPDEYVMREEGTYNPLTRHFACTECYMKLGMPTAPGRGWKAP